MNTPQECCKDCKITGDMKGELGCDNYGCPCHSNQGEKVGIMTCNKCGGEVLHDDKFKCTCPERKQDGSFEHPEGEWAEIANEYIRQNIEDKDFNRHWFGSHLKRLIPLILAQAKAGEREYKETAEKLWAFLDDIDTVPDMMKPNTSEAHEKCWRMMVKISEKRHNFLVTDGYSLQLPGYEFPPKEAQDSMKPMNFNRGPSTLNEETK